jgi:hypothetical protein
MTTTAIREKLHNYIDTVDDKQIESIYALFEDQIAPAVNWYEDEEFVAELDERLRRLEDGTDRGYSWEEVKAEIQARREKRYGK